MDYLKGLTNDELIAHYLVDLDCRKELTQYTYPNELQEPDDVIDEHVIRCQGILFEHIRHTVIKLAFKNNFQLSELDLTDIVDDRIQQLNPLLNAESERYCSEVIVKHIDFSVVSDLTSDYEVK